MRLRAAALLRCVLLSDKDGRTLPDRTKGTKTMQLRRLIISAAVLLGAGAPLAIAQRDAVSATLSPEAAAAAFNDAVITVCVPAASQGSVPASAQSKLQKSTDATTRRQVGAAADETVWDAMAAKGVVVVHEKPGRCTVSVYGPPAGATISGLASQLANAEFERLATGVSANGLGQTLTGAPAGRKLMVTLKGSDPGMPNHQSRFSVVSATVFSAQ